MSGNSPHSSMIGELLAVLILLVGVSGCTGTEARKAPPDTGNGPNIYVISHGWHTGIAIPADNAMQLGFLAKHFDTPARWYEIGWGDREFYQAEEITPGLTLRAGLWPTDTILHITSLPEPPDTYFTGSRVIGLSIDKAGLQRLTAAMADYFEYDSNSGLQVSGDGLYGDSLFFKATGRFHAFNTCNTWTARMLNRAGVPIRTFMTLHADSVMSQIEPFAVSDSGKRRN